MLKVVVNQKKMTIVGNHMVVQFTATMTNSMVVSQKLKN